MLFSTALVNLFTKEMATIAGVSFSLVFFVVFTVSERAVAEQHATGESGLEQFNVAANTELSAQAMEVRPGNILVAVRDPHNLSYLRDVLSRVDTTKTDVVVMTARIYHREHSFSGNIEMESSEVFDKYEQELFTAVVTAAEKEGKHVSLVVVPTNDVFEGIVATAQRLDSTVVVCGLSNKLTADEQGKLTGDAWERLPEPRPRLSLVVVGTGWIAARVPAGAAPAARAQGRCRPSAQSVEGSHQRSEVPRAASLPRAQRRPPGDGETHARRQPSATRS